MVTTSHFPSYADFEEAHRHTVAILSKELPQSRLLGLEGKEYALSEAAKISGKDCARFAGTKFFGSAFLASKILPDGLSLDTGTTSTDIIPLVGGKIDPESLVDPTAFHLRRMASGRLCWIGLTATPLDYIAREIETKFGKYSLFPRLGYSEAIAAILEFVPPELARLHAYGGLYPSKEEAFFPLAQAVGGDRILLDPEKLEALAKALHQEMIKRVALSIEKVSKDVHLKKKIAVVSGLGREAIARKALLQAGFMEEDIFDLDSILGRDHLASASSAYGLALMAAERFSDQAFSLLP
ncbi:MAG TPA: hypothetical protein DD435_06995 [Cyanobacteria bacterium UBA8530]|nr:hypothetical protein [Cyanobacteria bacterium UBA8530]